MAVFFVSVPVVSVMFVVVGVIVSDSVVLDSTSTVVFFVSVPVVSVMFVVVGVISV
jgi:hypothetical protein